MAQEFGVSAQTIAGILGAIQRRLAREGQTSRHLREAAREQAELDRFLQPASKSASQFELAGQRRRRH